MVANERDAFEGGSSRFNAANIVRIVLPVALVFLMTTVAWAGGPRWVAGSTYFNAGLKGKPIAWKNGQVNYYTDLGDLSATVNQSQANAMIATAASIWSSVPTAGVSIQGSGSLAEDVNGTNVVLTSTTFTMPADIDETATQKPLAIVYDLDGKVTDTLLGAGASNPNACLGNGVTLFVDSIATDATIAHALMIVNGRCATPAKMSLLQYLMIRAFGRVLGLDWSQANEGVFNGSMAWSDAALAGWPLMHPIERMCDSTGMACMQNQNTLRWDDMAALSRLYPVTTANRATYPGKKITAASTVAIQGTLRFRWGQGMQGVNVVARPLLPGTDQPDLRYPVAAVSGALFTGNAGNPVSGFNDAQGNLLNNFGSDDPTLEGWYDLSGISLPPGLTQADYQITFEAVDPLDTQWQSVGPYTLGQTTPSGTTPVFVVRGLKAGSAVTQDATIQDSDQDLGSGNDGSEASPVLLAGNGEWLARINGYGHTGWFQGHFRACRVFTIEAQSLDSAGQVSDHKARVLLGVWQASDAPGSSPRLQTWQPYLGDQVGLTWLTVQTIADGDLRLGVTDQRGDGRPDYLYRGRVLYADTVTPTRLDASGGAIVIRGTGFRPQNVVMVNGLAAAITSVTSEEITAIAPPCAPGVTGNVDVMVSDPATLGSATILGGLSYDAQDQDSIGIVTAPQNAVSMGVPLPFTTRTMAGDGVSAAGHVNVTYTVTSGSALLGCGQLTCVVTSSGDGVATLMVTANSSSTAVVTASLSSGASVQAHFRGLAAPQISSLTSKLYLAQGAVFQWSPQALVLVGGVPSAGQTVTWSTPDGVTTGSPSTLSNAQGLVNGQLTVGPLAENVTTTVNACLPGGTPGGGGCTGFVVASVHPELAGLATVSGTEQILSLTDAPAPIVLRVLDAAGHSMAGGVVSLYQVLTEWAPPCPAAGRCPAAPVLAATSLQATSGADGLVVFVPLSRQGTPTRLEVLAVTGNTGTLGFEIEQHP